MKNGDHLKLNTIKIREQFQILVSKKEVIEALGFNPDEWNIHSAYVSSLDEGNITFGVSAKSIETPFEMP